MLNVNNHNDGKTPTFHHYQAFLEQVTKSIKFFKNYSYNLEE